MSATEWQPTAWCRTWTARHTSSVSFSLAAFAGCARRSEPADEFRRIVRRLGIEDITLYTLRHTVTTMVQDSGLPLKGAQSLMGHATDWTTRRIYSYLTSTGLEGVAAVMERCFANVDLGPAPKS